MDEKQEEDFCFIIRRASRIAAKFYEYYFKENQFGLKYTQFSLLSRIRGDKSLSALSRSLGVERTTLNRTFELLKKNGFIVVKKEKWPSKEKIASLTEEGKRAVEVLKGTFDKAQELFFRIAFYSCPEGTLSFTFENLDIIQGKLSEELDLYAKTDKEDSYDSYYG